MADLSFAVVLETTGAVVDPSTGKIVSFGDVPTEYRRLKETAGLGVIAHDVVVLSGSDRAKFLHNFCTNDVVKLPVGSGCEAFFLNPKGKILDYGVIYAGAEEHWIELESGRGSAMVAHLDRFLFREDVRLSNRSGEFSTFHIGGPRAGSALADATVGVFGTLENLQHVAASIGGYDAILRRRDRSIHPGFDVLCPVGNSIAIWQHLLKVAIAAGGGLVGQTAMEMHRVEAGLPRFGYEVTEANLPQEIGRDSQTISFTKGCYIGQETVARLDAYGHVNKLLRGLVAQAPVKAGQSVMKDAKEIGTIASAIDSPRMGSVIALAVVRAVGGEPGSTVTVTTSEGGVPARITALPFGG